MLGCVYPIPDVELNEEHVVSLFESRGLDSRQLAQLELQIVERVHP
jgi:hypothetical protein